MTVPRQMRGSLTLAQLSRALKAFPNMPPQDRKIAREFFVGGLTMVEIARINEVTVGRVRYLCGRILGAHGVWVAQTGDEKKQPVRRSSGEKKKSGAD